MTSMRERLMLLDQDPEITAELPSLLKASRKRAGINQGEIAAELGVSRQTVSTYETGQYVPMRGLVIAWAALTGHKLSPLLDAWDKADRRYGIRSGDTRVGVSPQLPFPSFDLDEMTQYSAGLYTHEQEVNDAISGSPQSSGGGEFGLEDLHHNGGGRASEFDVGGDGFGRLDRPLSDREASDGGLHGDDREDSWGTAAALRCAGAAAA